MGFLSRIRDTFSTELDISDQWTQLKDTNELDRLFQNTDRLSVIFKHSTACGTSGFVLRSVEKKLPEMAESVDYYIIEVRSQRKLSNYVEEKTGVRHESPQIILLKGGEAVWSASHTAIYPENVLEQIKKFK